MTLAQFVAGCFVLSIALCRAGPCAGQAGKALLADARSVGKPPVTALAISPDGKSLVVGSQAGLEVRSWPKLRTARKLATELAHVHDLAFSPDGKLLAAAGGAPAEKGIVEVYRWPALELAHRSAPHKDVVYAVAWRGDSAVFATASADTEVVVHEAETGKPDHRLLGHSRAVLSACYLPEGKRLVTAGVDETLRLWDGLAVVRSFTNHTGAVNQVALRPVSESQSQPMIASAGDDRTVRFWQPAIGRLVRFVRLDHIPQAIVWSSDGASVLAACSDGRVRTIDAETAEVRDVREAIDGVAYAIAAAADGSIAVGGANGQVHRLAAR